MALHAEAVKARFRAEDEIRPGGTVAGQARLGPAPVHVIVVAHQAADGGVAHVRKVERQ
jgi:hypothetical protein